MSKTKVWAGDSGRFCSRPSPGLWWFAGDPWGPLACGRLPHHCLRVRTASPSLHAHVQTPCFTGTLIPAPV